MSTERYLGRRGIVITRQIIESSGGFSEGEGPLDMQLFRKYLTYWDEIDFVDIDASFCGPVGQELAEHDPDVRLAKEHGSFKVFTIEFPDKTEWFSEEVPYIYCRAQALLANKLNANLQGCWSIGQSVSRLQLPEDQSSREAVIVSKLLQALPVPGPGVTAERILRFRELRSAEFQAFRGAYDDLYQSVLSKPDTQLAIKRAIEEVKKALLDVRQVMDEGGMDPRQASLKTLWQIIRDPLKTYAELAAIINNPVSSIPLLMGTIQAAFSVSAAMEEQPRNLPGKVKDYAYLGHVEADLDADEEF